MRLILTEYISSLKEDKELDRLIQDILKAHRIQIFSQPDKGRQHGVDIYAVGKDFEDGGKKKVFLITVKQGDLDRRNWSAELNSVRQSLDSIRDVFIRSNLATQHKKLPIKIVVAFNGMLKQNLQQDWRGYTEGNPQYEFTLWQNDWLLEQFEEKLLNEQSFSSEFRSQMRKAIIYLENPEYDLKDISKLLDLFKVEFTAAKTKKNKLKLLRELQVIVSIILQYCRQGENLLHAVKICEKYILSIGSILFPGGEDKEFTLCFFGVYQTAFEHFMRYYHKLAYIAEIRDGFSLNTLDAVVYTDTLYQQVGIFAAAGLITLQQQDICREAKSFEPEQIAFVMERFDTITSSIAASIVNMVNNNQVFYTPRADDQLIEISLIFVFLYRLGLKDQIASLLRMLFEQMAEGYIFLHIFPELYNNKRKIAELETDYDKRKKYTYGSSNLFTILTEWSVIVGDSDLYGMFRDLKENQMKDIDLCLWFPEKETEVVMYEGYASVSTGYSLSNIVLPATMAEYELIVQREFAANCHEKEFEIFKQSMWSMGLIASRHFRTLVFPYYWRQFLKPLKITREENTDQD